MGVANVDTFFLSLTLHVGIAPSLETAAIAVGLAAATNNFINGFTRSSSATEKIGPAGWRDRKLVESSG